MRSERSGIGGRRWVRGGLLLALSLATSGDTCHPSSPLAPSPGAPEYRAPVRVAVPGGTVDVAGGNLLVTRSDLDIDTQLGPLAVGASWSSATRRWTWSFDDLAYANDTFVDATGSSYGVGLLAPGAAIPGTTWVKLGPNALKTKGGLEYDFSASGRPLAVHWTSSPSPSLRFTQAVQGDGRPHTTAIDQCLAPAGDCHPVFAISYDAQGRVVRITDRAGRQALFGYDANGRLASARDGLDVAENAPGFRYEYAAGDLAAITSSEGERVQYQYDAAHRVTQVVQVGLGNPTRSFAYQAPDAAGIYTTRMTDPLGFATSFRYDASAQLLEAKAIATGETTTRTWASRRVTAMTLPSGVTTSWTYRDDDVATRTDPSGNVTVWSYKPSGVDRASPERRPVASVSDALGSIEQRSYDAAGRLLSITNGAGETTSVAYGADEMVSRITSAAGLTTTFSGYGEHGHAASATLGDTTRSFAYDAVGNPTRGPDLLTESGPGRGGIASRSFDADRNVSAVQLAGPQGSASLTIEHRSDHQVLRIERPGGGNTELGYDALGRLVQRSERAGGAWHATTFDYDADGRMTALHRPNGMGEGWTYDALGRTTVHSILRGGATEDAAGFVWSAGRLAWMLDNRSGSESYEYDAAGRVDAVAYGSGDRMELGWDARSRLVDATLRTSDGGVLRELGLGYDAAGREAAVLDGGVARVQRTFTGGRLAQTRYGNGLTRRFTYDPALGTLVGATMTNAASATVEATTVNDSDPTCAVLDERCITAQTTTTGFVAATSRESYLMAPGEGEGIGQRVGAWAGDVLGYDLLGNLTAGTNLGVLDYDTEGSRLLDVRQNEGGPVTQYAYDAAGFTTARGGVPIGWDGAGRIASVGSASFAWDVLGRPVSSAVGGAVTKRRFGGLVETDAAGGSLAIDLGEVRIDLAGQATCYRHFDFRGNVKLVTDAGGNVVEHYQYAPFGVDQVLGAGADPVRFARGKAVGDLFAVGHRLYDPLAARFLSPDPIPQLVNQYAYALGNPVQLWDPAGADSWVVEVATGLAGYAGGRIGQAVGGATGAEWGAAIGGLAAGPPGVAIGAAVGGLVGGVVGGAYGGAGAANMVHEALTGEQLFGLRFFVPESGSGSNGGSGAAVGGPAMSTGNSADVDRGFPIPPTHACGGDACGGRGMMNGLTFYDTLPAGGYGSCAPLTLGGVGDARLLGALLAANGALGLHLARSRRRERT